MEQQIILQRIREILSDISRLSGSLQLMEATAGTGRLTKNHEDLSIDAALLGERIACRLRHLVYTSAEIKKTDYLNAAADALDIRISEQNGILEIALPCLIPKKKRRQSTEYLFDALYFALDRYVSLHGPPKYRQCVVCVLHIYARDTPGRMIRDYDNLELKAILDIVTAFAVTDDTGLLCDAYNATEFGDTDCTRILVMDKNGFAEWISKREKLS
jgi:hypothetical protein